jgi:peptidyl-prolyl cis-trans isomerase A (cyclophilin A)
MMCCADLSKSRRQCRSVVTTIEETMAMNKWYGVLLGLVGCCLMASLGFGCRSPQPVSPAPGDQQIEQAQSEQPQIEKPQIERPRESVKAPAQAEPSATPSLHPRIRVKTTKGEFVLELDAEIAPISTVNFCEYVKAGFYDRTIVHRVVDAMIQAGRYYPDLSEKTDGVRGPIRSEWGNGLVNRLGTIGMVRRVGDPNSATCEFYINLGDNFELDMPRDSTGFTVFGKVVEGWETIQAIAKAPVGTHPNYAAGRSAVVPKTPIIIESMTFDVPLDWETAREMARIANLNQEDLKDKLIDELVAANHSEVVVTDSGLVYIDIREGRGASPSEDDAVEVYYRGTLLNGHEFESELNEPKLLEMKYLIDGWREGMRTMREGGKRVLIVPPKLGFGSSGVPGRIPGDAWLVFEVELLLVREPPPVPGFGD